MDFLLQYSDFFSKVNDFLEEQQNAIGSLKGFSTWNKSCL